MAYPIVDRPYGFKPVNLIGGQPFAGSTRSLPIQYGYGTNIFYGDAVVLSAVGTIVRATITNTVISAFATGTKQTIGIFLGCSFTDPVTKQKRFMQYYPAGTYAGDTVAVISDDPDTIFKAAMVTAAGGVIISSASQPLVGLNLAGSDLAGSTFTGNSSNGLVAPTVLPTTNLPFRVVDLVKETSYSIAATESTISSTTTLNVAALTTAIPVGAEVWTVLNGVQVFTGSFVAAAAAVGATTVTLNLAPAYTTSAGSQTTVPAGSALAFIVYPEVLVKLNFGIHSYYGV